MSDAIPTGARTSLRARWFAQLSASLDDFMRSPTFLEAMRCLLDAANRAQSLQNAGVTALYRWSARELGYEPCEDGSWTNNR
ncbi:MAG TPA: hypothetical protein VI299_03585 [Polyangiales bacterium]